MTNSILKIHIYDKQHQIHNSFTETGGISDFRVSGQVIYKLKMLQPPNL